MRLFIILGIKAIIKLNVLISAMILNEEQMGEDMQPDKKLISTFADMDEGQIDVKCELSNF